MLLYCVCLSLPSVILALTLFAYILRHQKRLPVTPKSRCLLVIAHPDDETMFFGPTLQQLVASGCNVYILCLTSGNADGLGAVRKKELVQAVPCLGVRRENLTILDMSSYQDGQTKWEIEKLSSVILHHLEKLDCDFVITFDERGVSGHPNHAACFFTLQFLYTNGHIPAGVQVFVLESVRLYRKYIGVLDVFASFNWANFMYVSSPLPVYRAMCCHRSQLLWFRYLYMCFSRYVTVNTLRRIPIHRYCNKK